MNAFIVSKTTTTNRAIRLESASFMLLKRSFGRLEAHIIPCGDEEYLQPYKIAISGQNAGHRETACFRFK